MAEPGGLHRTYARSWVDGADDEPPSTGTHRRTRPRDEAAERLAATGYDDAAREARSPARHLLTLLVLTLGGAAPGMMLDMTAANISSINEVFHTGQISWVLTAGTLTGAVTVVPVGKLGDIYGKKRVLVAVLTFVLAGLLLTASTTDFSLLLVGAAVQGLAVNVQVCQYGIVRDVLPRRWVPLSVGALVGGFLAGVPISVMAGGYLTEHFSYHSMSWVLAGYVGLVVVLTVLFVPESPLRTRDRMDWNSTGVMGVALFMVTYGLNEPSIPGRGWTSAWTIGFVAVGLLLLAFWMFYERRPEQSTIGLNVMTTRSVNSVLVITLLTGVMFYIMASAAPTVGETPREVPVGLNSDGSAIMGSPGFGLGLSVFRYGQLSLWTMLPGILAALVAALWARHRGARMPVIVGPLLFAGAMLYLSMVTTDRAQLIVANGLAQAGIGMLLVAYPLLIIEAVPAHAGGVGLAFAVIFQAIGDSVGSQLFATVTAAHTFVANPFSGLSVTTHHGIQLACDIGAGFGLAAFTCGFLIPHGRTRSSGGALPAAAEIGAVVAAPGPVVGVARPSAAFPNGPFRA